MKKKKKKKNKYLPEDVYDDDIRNIRMDNPSYGDIPPTKKNILKRFRIILNIIPDTVNGGADITILRIGRTQLTVEVSGFNDGEAIVNASQFVIGRFNCMTAFESCTEIK